MAPHQDYRGPVGLLSSRFANPRLVREFLASSGPSSTSSALLVNTPAQENAVAVRMDQPVPPTNVTATTHGMTTVNGKATINGMAEHPTVQVAMEQAQALRQQVEEHSSMLTKAITAARNTRQILNMLHGAMERQDSQAATENLNQVQTLWKEMETFHENAQEARASLKTLVEQQSNAVNLALGSVMNSAYAGVQDELKTQHQKVEIQHRLILDQQQAFDDAKARFESQIHALKASHADPLNTAEVKLSNMTLKNGCLRTELEEMAKEYSVKVTELENANIKLKTDYETLEKERNELREKYKNRTGELEKDVTKLKTDCQMLEKELVEIREKYQNQSSEYGKVFASVGEQKKYVEALQKQIRGLEKSLVNSQEKLAQITSERDALLQRESDTKEASSTATQTSKMLEEELKRKDSAISSKEVELKTVKGALDIVKNENAKLINKQASFQEKFEQLSGQMIELKSSRGKLKAENELLKSSSDHLNDALAEKQKSLDDLKVKNDKLRAFAASSDPVQEKSQVHEHQLEDANKLVNALRERYQAILPMYKQAEQHRKENEELKQKLLEHEMNKATASTGNDASYWRDRYDQLLKHLED